MICMGPATVGSGRGNGCLQFYFIINFMKFLQRDVSSKRPYAKISVQKREQLVSAVLQEQLPISKVAKKLRIKKSTARLIVRKYKESGQFYAKKFKKRIPRKRTDSSPGPESPSSPPAIKQEQEGSFQQAGFSDQNNFYEVSMASMPIIYYYMGPVSFPACLF